MVPEHVCDWHLRHSSREQIRPLISRYSNKSSTIRSSINDEVSIVGVAAMLKVFSSCYEIVVAPLFVLLDCGEVPLLSKLSTSTNVGDDVQAVEIIEEDQVHEVERRRLCVVKTTIAVEYCWNWRLGLFVERAQNAFLSDKEHRHFGSIFALIPHLVSGEVSQVQLQICYIRSPDCLELE